MIGEVAVAPAFDAYKTLEGKIIAVLLTVSLAFMTWSVPTIEAFAVDDEEATSEVVGIVESIGASDDAVSVDVSPLVGESNDEIALGEVGDVQNDAVLVEDEAVEDVAEGDAAFEAEFADIPALVEADEGVLDVL